jgi:phage-related protein
VAQKIVIDIVAETQKLKQGVDEAGTQLNSLDGKLKGLAATAGAAASAFVLKQGVTFLKQGIDEAKEAKETMTAANTTFGEGSAVLQKITADAEKFGKEIAVDNDVILQLATSLGSRLPADAKALSAELVNLGFDVEAYTGGAINAEAMTGKLAKALADGELKATDLQKIVPDLDQSVYEMAESFSKAGDNQKALTTIIEAAQKKYGDAAEKNVTSTQKFDTALADLKEQIGTKVLPIVETFITKLTELIEWFDGLPTPIQNLIVGLAGIIAIGGPLLTFLASMKTALTTLGIISGGTTGALTLLKIALAGLGIGLVIAAIVLLIQNWDNVTEAVSKFWNMIKDVVPKAWAKVKELKDKVVGFIGDIIDMYLELPKKMLGVGEDIVRGLWNGMTKMANWLREKVTGFFKNLLPSWAEKALGISSPSKVFADVGKNIISGLASTFNLPEVAKLVSGTTTPVVPRISARTATATNVGASPVINITVNAGLGTDPIALGREVQKAIKTYGKYNIV